MKHNTFDRWFVGIVICLIVGAVLILFGTCQGCKGYWEGQADGMRASGMTEAEVEEALARQQDEIARELKGLKNAVLDGLPVPGPKGPMKELTDYWLEALLAAAGLGYAGYKRGQVVEKKRAANGGASK